MVGSYYEGSWVCVDTNSNGVCDDNETRTVSDAQGNWILDNPQNRKLNVVAEIYVEDIKHTSSGSTLVEKPMIFIAPLQGEVNGQLTVSPISTMVYRSMQKNDTTFEVAKESVANELGVPSDILLTDYNIENPSADYMTLQQCSAAEIKKLEMMINYHNNRAVFLNLDIWGGKYVVKDFYIPSEQDSHQHIKIGTTVKMDIYYTDFGEEAGALHFVLGRKGSTHVANWWKNRVNSDQSNYNSEPHKLNFAMKGTLTVTFDKTYVFSDLFLAQGHNWTGNNLVDWR